MSLDHYQNDARQAKLTLLLLAIMSVIIVAMIVAAVLEGS